MLIIEIVLFFVGMSMEIIKNNHDKVRRNKNEVEKESMFYSKIIIFNL